MLKLLHALQSIVIPDHAARLRRIRRPAGLSVRLPSRIRLAERKQLRYLSLRPQTSPSPHHAIEAARTITQMALRPTYRCGHVAHTGLSSFSGLDAALRGAMHSLQWKTRSKW